MTSLKTLLALKPSVLYPAHGPHIPTREAATKHISDYILHRQEREDQIITLLQKLAGDEKLLSETMGDVMVKVKEDQIAEQKYDYEFFAGKPYNPKPKAKDPKDQKESKTKDGAVAKETKKGDGENGEDGEEGEEEKEEDPVEIEKREKAKYRQSIADKFPASKGVTVSLICRILYKTDKESLVNAASKSVDAHLRKLEGEGKVRRVGMKLPVVTEGKIGEAEDGLPGWEWAGEVGAEEVVGKIKVD